jgi:ketosteroid isomerase-like protein
MDGNRQHAIDLVSAMCANDLATMREVLAEDAEWHYPRSVADHGGSPTVVGREAIVAGVAQVFENLYAEMAPEFHHVVEEGNVVSSLCTVRGKTQQGGDYENVCVFFLRFDDGRVKEAWEVLDTAYAFAVSGRA